MAMTFGLLYVSPHLAHRLAPSKRRRLDARLLDQPVHRSFDVAVGEEASSSCADCREKVNGSVSRKWIMNNSSVRRPEARYR
jgi:hypothetical protein